ncbi:hypothetical protein [Paenibacillus sp. 1A_MP2]|uniref:hypothetical protein n=1 Tax=Paenibacillus sp. 1A_MP2 TaxID=3457495 RepID=UPI003FCD1ABE
MSKLTRKLLVRIISALCVVFFLSFIVNTFFLPTYFLYQKKQKLANLTTEISASGHDVPIQRMESLETQYEVAIAYTSLKDSVNDINDQLLWQYNRKGIALSKFWLTEESITALREGARVNKFYDQTKLKSSFLVNFVKVGIPCLQLGNPSRIQRRRFELLISSMRIYGSVCCCCSFCCPCCTPPGSLNRSRS